MARPKFAQSYPFPWTDHQTPPPASSLDPSDLWCQTESGSDPPFSTMHWTDRQQTHRPTDGSTDRPRESLMTIGRYASNESDVSWKLYWYYQWLTTSPYMDLTECFQSFDFPLLYVAEFLQVACYMSGYWILITHWCDFCSVMARTLHLKSRSTSFIAFSF